VITLDTSALFALLDGSDPDQPRVSEALFADPGPYLVPVATLGEITYLVERRLGSQILDAFLADLADGALTLDCGDEDLPRARELVHRYRDLPLGFVDAAVVACAERNGRRVLTLDRRDFDVVAREDTIDVVPR